MAYLAAGRVRRRTIAPTLSRQRPMATRASRAYPVKGRLPALVLAEAETGVDGVVTGVDESFVPFAEEPLDPPFDLVPPLDAEPPALEPPEPEEEPVTLTDTGLTPGGPARVWPPADDGMYCAAAASPVDTFPLRATAGPAAPRVDPSTTMAVSPARPARRAQPVIASDPRMVPALR